MISVDYATFKSVVNAQSLAFKYVTLDSTQYYMYTLDPASQIACTLAVTSPAGSDQADFEANLKPKGNRSAAITMTAFADKILPDGRRLYVRLHGVSATVAGAPDNIDFVVPYNTCKIVGLEIINGDIGDTVNFKVLDTPTGTLSGVPNYPLNQFGFNVNVAAGFYKRESNYDADLIKDMKIRLEYDAVNSDLLPKTVYVNFCLHEVK